MRRARAIRVALLLVALAGAGCAAAPPPTPALSPLRAAEAKRTVGGAATQKPILACAQPPAPLRDIIARKFYTDAANSLPDPAIIAANRDSLKPLNDFSAQVQKLAENALLTGNPTPARCAVTWLAAWAKGDAMLGRMEEAAQAGYERKWQVVALALPYLMIRDIPTVCPSDNADCMAINRWFATLAAAVKPPYEDARRSRPNNTSARNNHQNWAGAAVMLAAIAANDRALFDWAAQRFRYGLAEIQDDGTLPLEVARGQRAAHYHSFALAPLLIMAEELRANGITLTAADRDRLKRLADRVRLDLADPGFMAAKAGVAQESSLLANGKIGSDRLIWAEAWYDLSRDPAVVPLLAPNRPLSVRSFGGNWTLFFGAALP